MAKELIVVLDFGGQYSHLITRRIRECQVYSELLPYTVSANEVSKLEPKGIVLSGGPASVYEANSPNCDPRIFTLGVPILGICYGLQLMVQALGGKVKATNRREFGKTELKIADNSDLLRNVNPRTNVWMSHGDCAEVLPVGFEVLASSDSCNMAAIRKSSDRLYGVQFHPEVAHTVQGMDVIRNFVLNICGCSPNWTPRSIIDTSIENIRTTVGNGAVLVAVSGGIDSTTVAALVRRAVRDRLTCIFVNHGLLRKNEEDLVMKAFKDLELNVRYVDATDRFLKRLEGVIDPEMKRKIIGEEFINVFDEESAKLGSFEFLAQGTLYPDVIESGGTGSVASRIKTHHNVGGIPEWSKFEIIEPLRFLYKDEVRKIASELGISRSIVSAHPFPGPGLAVRIIGEVTREKLRICREASYIVEETLRRHKLYDELWQAFAVVGEDRAVGVLGDERKLGHIVTIRVVTSFDGMTADWARLSDNVLEEMSTRITGEIPGVTWVSYSVTSKPPSTIEPC
ncbi:MAG TPA: glutamine-hydrolyzing GMP synthase [Candidatus Acidoferrum sp.]|nr:glutamine-hydrolyzing GMP synthase [Candidatus Acidoferrum sp.]